MSTEIAAIAEALQVGVSMTLNIDPCEASEQISNSFAALGVLATAALGREGRPRPGGPVDIGGRSGLSARMYVLALDLVEGERLTWTIDRVRMESPMVVDIVVSLSGPLTVASASAALSRVDKFCGAVSAAFDLREKIKGRSDLRAVRRSLAEREIAENEAFAAEALVRVREAERKLELAEQRGDESARRLQEAQAARDAGGAWRPGETPDDARVEADEAAVELSAAEAAFEDALSVTPGESADYTRRLDDAHHALTGGAVLHGRLRAPVSRPQATSLSVSASEIDPASLPLELPVQGH